MSRHPQQRYTVIPLDMGGGSPDPAWQGSLVLMRREEVEDEETMRRCLGMD